MRMKAEERNLRLEGQRGRPRLFVSGAAGCWSYFFDNLTASPDIVAAPAG